MSTQSDGQRRKIPVDPPVHIETFATHYTLTWKADRLSRFKSAVQNLDTVPSSARAIINDTSVAGRQRVPVSAIDAESETTTYVRVESDDPWTLSWDQRTWPVVSVSGTPPLTLCQHAHIRTTECANWNDEVVEILDQVISTVTDN
jgi:hypothetical protein